MLTPTRSFTWRGETFKAGTTRVAPDHPVAGSEHAHLLEPAYGKESGNEILRFLERMAATPAGRPTVRKPWHVERPKPSKRWRLK